MKPMHGLGFKIEAAPSGIVAGCATNSIEPPDMIRTSETMK
jgi:hypothetical protein